MANFSVSLKNMEISVFGMKFRLDIIILLIVSYFLLWGHVICSCSNGTVAEAFENKEDEEKKEGLNVKGIVNGIEEAQNANLTTKEGFVGANTNFGESSKYDLSIDKPINTSKWFTPNLTYKKGNKVGKGVQNILNRKKQPIPLPEGELLLFANTQSKPECCPNAYSTSKGCVCATVDQYNYLINRGGNNVPYSEY
jgi:hypothetical protein